MPLYYNKCLLAKTLSHELLSFGRNRCTCEIRYDIFKYHIKALYALFLIIEVKHKWPRVMRSIMGAIRVKPQLQR